MKHTFLSLLFLFFSYLIAAANPYHLKMKSDTLPNIIFILVDDLGWGDLGVLYQNQRKQANDRSQPWAYTPNLDQMALDGATLPQQYCAAPVCAPSRASILLGLSQGHANVRDNQFDKALEDNYTMASTLRQIGYATAAIGKWGLQGETQSGETRQEPNWPAHPLNRGFDYFLGYIRHKDGHEHYPKEGLYDGPKQVWENKTNIASGLGKCYTADLWTAAAKRWIVAHKQGEEAKKPFFMYLAYDTPHAVLELPTQPYPQGGGMKGGMQWLGEKGHMISTASGKPDTWIHPDYAKVTWDNDKDPATAEVPWPEVYQRYATSTRRIDDAVGDMIQLLKDLNIDRNTMIVFTSDNGPSKESYLPESYHPNSPDFFDSFGPFDGIKRDCWEGGIRMPTLVRWPGRVQAGKEVSSPSASYDWAVTFLDAAGMPAPARMDGISLMPSLTGQGKQQHKVVYVEYFQQGTTPDYSEFSPQHQNRRRNQMQMIRRGAIVGVRYDVQSAEDDFEIYDVIKDPKEIHNLADSDGIDTLQQWMKDEVLQMRRPNTSAPRPYDDALVPAIEEKQTKPGVRWKAYEGNFPWIPQVASLKAKATGRTARPDVSVGAGNKKGILYFEGYLNIPADGDYTFYMKADQGALLRVHQATVIEADYGYQGKEKEGAIKLEAGLHPFRLYYNNKGNSNKSLDFAWSGPGISKQAVPAAVFWAE